MRDDIVLDRKSYSPLTLRVLGRNGDREGGESSDGKSGEKHVVD